MGQPEQAPRNINQSGEQIPVRKGILSRVASKLNLGNALMSKAPQLATETAGSLGSVEVKSTAEDPKQKFIQQQRLLDRPKTGETKSTGTTQTQTKPDETSTTYS